MVVGPERQGGLPPAGEGGRVRIGAGDFPVPATAALGNYTIRVQSGDAQGLRRLRGAGVPQARVRSDRHAGRRASSCRVARRSSTCRRATTSASRSRTANVRWVVNQQPYYSPLRWDDGCRRRRRAATGTATIRPPRARCGSTPTARRRSGFRSAWTTNGRDFSARIEAQVTDAANREVSGSTVVHATYGTFLLGAQTERLGLTAPASTVARHDPRHRLRGRRAAERAGHARARAPAVPSRATTTSPKSTQIATQQRRRPTPMAARLVDVHAAQPDRQLPRSRHARRAANARCRMTSGCGCRARATTRRDSGDRYLELLVGQSTYQPGESARADRPRRNRHRPGAGDQGRPARVVVPAAAADAPPTRSRSRSTTATSATCSSTSPTCETAGCIAPSGGSACRPHRGR